MKSKTTKLSMIMVLILLFSNLAIRVMKRNQDHFTKLGSGIITSTYDPYGSPVQNNNFVSNSYYMDTTDNITLGNLGYNEGQSLFSIPGNQDEVVILDFGDPYYIYPDYGTLLVDSGLFRSLDQITSAVYNYANGFYVGNHTTSGSDKIMILVGTNNCCTGTGMVTQAHGAQWGTMINNIYNYLDDPDRTNVAGAIDIEMKYSTVVIAKSWALGYFDNSHHNYMYNFGIASGCPQIPSSQSNSCDNNWSQADIYQLSSTCVSDCYNAKPLPEIYAVDEANAKQWYCLSYYGYYGNYYASLDIRGTLTEYQACIQDLNHNHECYNDLTYNNPSVGSQQLYKWLHQNTYTSQSLYWNTDIQHGTGE